MKTMVLVCSLLVIAGCGRAASPLNDTNDSAAVSDIKPDETVVFFNTSGWLDESKQEWHLPIHGWVYEPEDSTVRKAAFARILESKYDLVVGDETKDNFSRRLNLLIADNERGKKIVVRIADRNFTLAASTENGHFESTLVLPAAEVEPFATNGLMPFNTPSSATGKRVFTGTVRLVAPRGISVISDIDDTVKISKVGDRRSLLEQTFLLDFAAASGMADLYRKWSNDDATFHYVSSSPWQLYSPLNEFLEQAGFPWATFSLKAVRFRDETLLDLFKEGTETKPPAIRKILKQYPDRKFILVGDSGEQDPEVYAALLRENPEQILQIYIRNVTDESADDERYTALFADVDEDRWQLFEETPELDSSSVVMEWR